LRNARMPLPSIGARDTLRSTAPAPQLEQRRSVGGMRPVVITVFDSEAGTSTDYSFAASPVRIGRNPLNDLPLPFAFVSGWHAVLRFDESVAKFFDLGSTNGTTVHGRRVEAGEAVVVDEHVRLQIGKLELRFRRDYVSAAAAGPSSGGTLPAEMPGQLAAVARNDPGGAVAAGTIDPHRAGAPGQGGGATAHVQMSDVHQTVDQLRAGYEHYRQSWSAFYGQLEGAVSSMSAPLRGFAVSILAREFPALAAEGDFAELSARSGARLPTGSHVAATVASPTGGGGSVGAVTRLAESLRPGEEPPRSPEEAQRFLTCVEDVLRASAKAFVELQKGQEQFGSEMGVRTIKEFTALHAAGTAENVLKYLLDWQQGGPHRTKELVGVYADLMIHQVALINGVMEGVRSLLARLDPQEIEREVTASWPTRAAATWKHYADRYRQLTEDDKRITQAVFGPEFARAYAEVGGEGGG
jgi:predicted component of type VI protein secretion system